MNKIHETVVSDHSRLHKVCQLCCPGSSSEPSLPLQFVCSFGKDSFDGQLQVQILKTGPVRAGSAKLSCLIVVSFMCTNLRAASVRVDYSNAGSEKMCMKMVSERDVSSQKEGSMKTLTSPSLLPIPPPERLLFSTAVRARSLKRMLIF